MPKELKLDSFSMFSFDAMIQPDTDTGGLQALGAGA